MFLIQHGGSLQHWIKSAEVTPGKIHWTTDIRQAQSYDLKIDADWWEQYIRCHGFFVNVILTFGAQKG